jgi:hypothetical protein
MGDTDSSLEARSQGDSSRSTLTLDGDAELGLNEDAHSLGVDDASGYELRQCPVRAVLHNPD